MDFRLISSSDSVPRRAPRGPGEPESPKLRLAAYNAGRTPERQTATKELGLEAQKTPTGAESTETELKTSERVLVELGRMRADLEMIKERAKGAARESVDQRLDTMEKSAKDTMEKSARETLERVAELRGWVEALSETWERRFSGREGFEDARTWARYLRAASIRGVYEGLRERLLSLQRCMSQLEMDPEWSIQVSDERTTDTYMEGGTRIHQEKARDRITEHAHAVGFTAHIAPRDAQWRKHEKRHIEIWADLKGRTVQVEQVGTPKPLTATLLASTPPAPPRFDVGGEKCDFAQALDRCTAYALAPPHTTKLDEPTT